MEEKYINKLLFACSKAIKKGNIPISALIVKNNKIISIAYNKKETSKISIDHAEILAIKKACKKLKTWRLDDCILYTTLKPCMMCEGAIIESRIKKVYYLLDSKYYKKNELINYEQIKLNNDYEKLLKNFFNDIRK